MSASKTLLEPAITLVPFVEEAEDTISRLFATLPHMVLANLCMLTVTMVAASLLFFVLARGRPPIRFLKRIVIPSWLPPAFGTTLAAALLLFL